MNVTLSPTWRTDARRGAQHFEQTLAALPLVRPRYQTDTWTAVDAAQYWQSDYDPEAVNSLPPMLVLGVVARCLLRNIGDHPLMKAMVKKIISFAQVMPLPQATSSAASEQVVFSRNTMVKALHYAWVPSGADHPGNDPYWTYILPSSATYCDRKTCRNRGSWLQGCLSEPAYNHAIKRNYLVPWSQVKWGGLSCLLPPLRNCTLTPSVSVQRSRSHQSRYLVPIWVEDRLARVERTLPPMMLDYRNSQDFMIQVRSHLERLAGERLRYWGIRASSSDCADRMRQWDHAWAASCWSLGLRDTVYDDMPARYWGLPDDVYERLCDSQQHTLFPVIEKHPF